MAKATEYEEDIFFQYPVNMLDVPLASLILLYRNRGEVIEASPSSYLCCSLENTLVRQGKLWFGKVYSQIAWDRLLTPNAQGYPITPYEMHVLGYSSCKKPDGNAYSRDEISQFLHLPESLLYVIIQDLEQFGFLSFGDQSFIQITNEGEKALQGISRRVFKKRYIEEFLPHLSGTLLPISIPKSSKSATRSSVKQQSSLF